MSDSPYSACKARVHTRGVPPDSFLDDLVAWGRSAPESLFTVNDRPDIYGNIRAELGPWQGILHRRAAMLEVLRVLAGFESSWHWNEGVDVTNKTSMANIEGQETGIFQVSANATHFDPSLRDFVIATIGTMNDGAGTRYNGFVIGKFIAEMKQNHAFAIGFAARLLRFTVKHNGPVLRREINPWLRRAAVAEFEKLLIS